MCSHRDLAASRRRFLGSSLLSAVALPALFSQDSAPSSGADLTAHTSKPGHWTVQSDNRLLCDAVCEMAPRKPYVQSLATLDGRNILLDGPDDHLHHHGLMFAIRANGINFWEETPGTGLQFPAAPPRTELLTDPQFAPGTIARGSQTLHWIPDHPEARCDPAGHALLIEERTLTLGIHHAQRATCLDWSSHFTIPEARARVELQGSSYNGLGMRFLRALDPAARFWVAPADPADSTPVQPVVAGGKQPVTPGRWAAALFDGPETKTTVLLIPAPADQLHPPCAFFTMKEPFAYLSATPELDKKPRVYTAGQTFRFDFLILLFPELKSPESLDSLAAKHLASGARRPGALF